MKKGFMFILIIVSLLSITIVVPKSEYVEAKQSASTIAELKTHLAQLKKDKKANDQQKVETQNSISKTNTSVKNKKEEIVKNQDTITNAMDESKKLEVEIANGKKELESIMRTYQVSNSENVYLEYIFDSTSYEELVYRFAIMEQLMDYQNNRINQWKDKIDYNNQLKQDLEQKEVELNNQINSLSKELTQLGNKLDNITDMALDINAEIKSVEEQIQFYQSLGCGENEDFNTCISIKGDKIMIKPLVKGSVTSDYGYRLHPVQKVWKLHSGTDIAVTEGSKVYSVANGTVGKIVRKSSCGGNMVYIWHLVDGVKWTTTYMHLLEIRVKVGEKVTNETVIGLSGGKTTGYKYNGYDNCTTGAHLHFSLAKGWYQKDKGYNTHSKWVANLVNPKTTLKWPKSWTTRY